VVAAAAVEVVVPRLLEIISRRRQHQTRLAVGHETHGKGQPDLFLLVRALRVYSSD
jgi:hypothetical protein